MAAFWVLSLAYWTIYIGLRCGAVGAAGTEGVIRGGVRFVRFVLIVVFVVLALLVGLFIYGQLLQPDTRVIEQEAIDAS